MAAVEVDRRFDAHRKSLLTQSEPALDDLSDEQIDRIKTVYYAHRLEEDEEIRLDGFFEEGQSDLFDAPVPTFDEYAESNDVLDKVNRHDHARGKSDVFFRSEAEEVLSWRGIEIRLDPASPSWRRLSRALQAASIQAAEAIRARNSGDVVDTPKVATSPEPKSVMPLPV